jgi:3-oxoacyl-[acyl-carrier protein] reductase
MLLSPLDGVDLAPDYPELAGRRVLVTGIGGALGVEIVRLLADQQAMLVLTAGEATPELQALAEIVAPAAPELRLYTGPFADHDAILRVARAATQCLGGLDAVINLAEVGEPPMDATEAEIESMVTGLLAMPCLASRVVANRLRTTLLPGVIVNVVTSPRGASPRARLVAGIARATLAAFTRSEAAALVADGIRVNAIAPAEGQPTGGACISSIPDIATLALHLASGRSPALTGLVLEAYAG